MCSLQSVLFNEIFYCYDKNACSDMIRHTCNGYKGTVSVVDSYCALLFIPLHNEVVGGGGHIGFTQSVRLSVRPTYHVRSVAPTVLFGSILYLYILSSSFRTCVACKISCKISKFEFSAFSKICNFDFVLFHLGISYFVFVGTIQCIVYNISHGCVSPRVTLE